MQTCYNFLLTSRIILLSLDQKVSTFFVDNFYWKYWNILTQKIINNDLIKFKTIMNFNNFSCLIFGPEMF